jgi:hypothetical protein
VVVLLDGDVQDPDILSGALFAAKVGVPLWVVSDRVSVSPWLITHADLTIRPACVVDLLETVLVAHG